MASKMLMVAPSSLWAVLLKREVDCFPTEESGERGHGADLRRRKLGQMVDLLKLAQGLYVVRAISLQEGQHFAQVGADPIVIRPGAGQAAASVCVHPRRRLDQRGRGRLQREIVRQVASRQDT